MLGGQTKSFQPQVFRICFPKYFSPLLSTTAGWEADAYFTDFETMFRDTPMEKKNTQMILPVSYVEIQNNCISSEIRDDFSPSITVDPKYKNPVWKFRQAVYSVVLKFHRVTFIISEASA